MGTFLLFLQIVKAHSLILKLKENYSNKMQFKRNFLIAHWNLIGIAAQNFVKLKQLETCNTFHNHDLTCLSEICLDTTTSIDSNDLSLKGYNLHRVDDLDNVKKGGVYVYYKETLAVRILQTKLGPFIASKVAFKNKKKPHVILLYMLANVSLMLVECRSRISGFQT